VKAPWPDTKRMFTMLRRAEFGRCGTSGLGQAPKCFIAALCAFKDFAGDVPTSPMFLGPCREDFTGPFEGDFHVG